MLESAQDTYIVHEPVKLTVDLVNETSEIINFVGIRKLGMNMEYIFYEIIDPLGQLELRKSQYLFRNEAIGDRWPGQPLRPGQRVNLFLYPNITRCIDSHDCEVSTFSAPGTYKIRVVYSIPVRFVNLWKGEYGKLYSNQIKLIFRRPDSKEKDILDAIWSGNYYDLSTGDDILLSDFNKPKLQSVIDKYGSHPLIKYAYFALARQLLNENRASWNTAAEYFEFLRRQYPSFRFEEVGKHLAHTYHNLDRENDALRVIRGTLRDQPRLKDNYHFMWFKVFLEKGRLAAVNDWIEKRRAGQYCEEEEVEYIE